MRTICERLIRLVSRQAPAALDRYPRGFTGDVAHPARSIETRSPPGLLAPTLVTLPSMSLISSAPFADFGKAEERNILSEEFVELVVRTDPGPLNCVAGSFADSANIPARSHRPVVRVAAQLLELKRIVSGIFQK